MKVLIVGAGRMGVRHATGVLKSKAEHICIADISQASLDTAKQQLLTKDNQHRLTFSLFAEREISHYDTVIFATTAKNRIGLFRDVLIHTPQYALFEKPLGQNFEEVQELVNEVGASKVTGFVNLNMRMYSFIKELKKNLNELPQFHGTKDINFLGGTLGISANGIHYLDLLLFLFGASKAVLAHGEIEEHIIPSGRGPEFGDYGGWAMIRFFDDKDQFLGKSFISLTANSSVFGGWDIIGKNGRIRINELEGERVDILRNENSQMPLYRYAADYLPPVKSKVESPSLGDLTYEWIESLRNNENVLPRLEESLTSHKLLFDWLSLGSVFDRSFLIT